ncbi:MAG TPA: RagB/SusD family nutrient uptake outer membrane protein [Sediminibacterium sp.]|nr:RagB/SusD family nutrient uptake outer membrane protein [Sediminibacterium sp.]
MKKYSISFLLCLLIAAGCKKDFLTKTPIGQLTDGTSFSTYSNFQTYAWSLYDYFTGYGIATSAYPPTFSSQEFNSDNFVNTVSNGQSQYGLGTFLLPPSAAPSPASTPAGTSTGSLQTAQWDFSYVRMVNVMLDHIDGSSMTQADKDHWRSVGYFFRALRYYDLIAAFGNVPWIEHAITDTSVSVLTAPATSRDTVAQNILNNLIWAESHIKVKGDGANTINQDCVRFLISRFGLFEGTWRKYHNLADANTYLNACVTYSQKLLPNYTSIMSSYDDVYNTDDLTGKPGIILFKQYVPNPVLKTTSGGSNSNVNSAVTRYIGSTSWHADAPKGTIDSYLCTDGKPIGSSAVYAGDDSIYSVFRNRDRRLYFSFVPPYRVLYKNPNIVKATGASDTVWAFNSNPAHGEFIKLMNALPGYNSSSSTGQQVNKRLPMQQWSVDMQSGNIIPCFPHFFEYPNSLDQRTVGSVTQCITELGYFFWKFYCRLPLDVESGGANNSVQDCPLFRIEEVMLNYAEAQFELGAFTQQIADQTINKLRPRANLPNMIVANIDGSFDPKRDPSVPPVLWEIRRERRVELMGDGFRFNDLKRWAKGNYLNIGLPLGAKVKNADYNNKLTIDGTGYVTYKGALVQNGWDDKYYLQPIPLQELLTNPNLKQNPGWPSK